MFLWRSSDDSILSVKKKSDNRVNFIIAWHFGEYLLLSKKLDVEWNGSVNLCDANLSTVTLKLS